MIFILYIILSVLQNSLLFIGSQIYSDTAT